jgi:hypothetical protein
MPVTRVDDDAVPGRSPDAEIRLHLLATDAGGRQGPIRSGYRPAHRVRTDYLTTGIVHLIGRELLEPGEESPAFVTFLGPEHYAGCLRTGQVVEIQEGRRIVGHATVIRVINPLLQAAAVQGMEVDEGGSRRPQLDAPDHPQDRERLQAGAEHGPRARRPAPGGRLVLACLLGAVLFAPRGISVTVLSDAKRPITFRVDVRGDTAMSPSVRPCYSGTVVVRPQGESSIRVTVDDGRSHATHDFDVYLEGRAVGFASLVVSQSDLPDSPFEFEEPLFAPSSRFWSLFPQSLFGRGIVLGLALGLLVPGAMTLFRRRRRPMAGERPRPDARVESKDA